jgi:hypothetical protein
MKFRIPGLDLEAYQLSLPWDGLDETFWAWLAGFIDGEGDIGIARQKEPRSPAGAHHGVRVRVTNTSFEVMELIHGKVGGNLYRGLPPRNGHRPVTRITWNGKAAVELLLHVYPYLKIKRPQALLALKFGLLLREGGGKSEGLPSPNLKRREEIYKAIRELNQRGSRRG